MCVNSQKYRLHVLYIESNKDILCPSCPYVGLAIARISQLPTSDVKWPKRGRATGDDSQST